MRNNVSCVQTCLSFEQQSSCNIIGGSACTVTASDSDGDDDSNDGLTKKRATLDCDSDESCFAYTDGTFLCLDLATSIFG